MSKFTKEQRHNIYTKAYELHLKDIIGKDDGNHNGLNGMCDLIDETVDILNYDDYTLEDFPEFYALKPEGKGNCEFWWDNEKDITTRIEKFELIIEQTKL